MIEILINSFSFLGGLPTLAFIWLVSIIYHMKKEKDVINKKDPNTRMMIKVLCGFLVICLAISTVRYITKKYDPSDTKLQYDLNSSTFYAIGYDKRFTKAKLIFNSDVDKYGVNKAYIYDLPESVWEEFRCSASLGEYYNKHIKGIYKCEVIEYFYEPDYRHEHE